MQTTLITHLMALKIEEHIIREDLNLVAVNKPAGLLTIPDREGKEISLKQLLKNKYGEIFTVHRLDKETSGVVVFARNESSHKQLSKLFENRETTKIYFGLVLGCPAEQKGVINEPVGEHPSRKGIMAVLKKGKESTTEYEVLEKFRLYSFVQFRILTGRMHQIRVHMKHLGHPLVCDALYGDGKPVFISALKRKAYKLSKDEEAERPILSHLALHSGILKFILNGQEYVLNAEMPKDMRALLQQLHKTNR